MPRIKKIDKGVKVEFYLPTSLHDRLQIELYSDLEGKVPYGVKSQLLTSLIVDWLKTRGVVL